MDYNKREFANEERLGPTERLKRKSKQKSKISSKLEKYYVLVFM